MAVTYGFYNSLNKDRVYSAEQMSSIFNGIITDGVFSTVGNALTTIAGTGMQVIVKPGRAWFNSTWTLNDAQLPLTVSAADVSLTRIDAVILEVNSAVSSRANSIKVLTGTASANPTRPTLASTETLHQYALAYVTVKAGVTSITNADITINVGKTDCPFITSVLQQTNITDLFNQWDAEFTSWFENVQSQLAGDVAANLQNQITNVVDFGYGKNGNVAANTSLSDYTALTNFLNQELADMNTAGTTKLIRVAFAGTSGWSYGSGAWGGKLEFNGLASSTKVATAELSSHAYGKVLLRRDSSGAWSHCKVASTADVKALYNVGDIKFTQAKVTEGVWVKCDGRSFNANSAPLSTINGVKNGLAVEKMIPKSRLGLTNASQYFVYLGDEIAWAAFSLDTGCVFNFYNVNTGKIRYVTMKENERGVSGSYALIDRIYRAHGALVIPVYFYKVLTEGNYAHGIFFSKDDGETWGYRTYSNGTSGYDNVGSVQWDPLNSDYLFFNKRTGSSDGDYSTMMYGNAERGISYHLNSSGGTRSIAFYNPANQKYVKFLAKANTDSNTSYLYFYETTNRADDGSAIASSALTLINTNTGITAYHGQWIRSADYIIDESIQHLYIRISVRGLAGNNKYTDSSFLIDVYNKQVLTSSPGGTSFGEGPGQCVCSTSDCVYIPELVSCPIQVNSKLPDSTGNDGIDMYERNKYLVSRGAYLMFVSAPNGKNNKVIIPPLISGIDDANYYMKIAEET